MNPTKQLPTPYVAVIALIDGGDLPPIPLTGFMAETTDTHEPYFHAYNKCGYSSDLILKWDYLHEVCPGYAADVGITTEGDAPC